MDNLQEENNHAGAQSRAEGANLTDVLAANKLDAERYRWLRDHCTAEENPQHTWIVEAPGDEWDTAIDNAMAANVVYTPD